MECLKMSYVHYYKRQKSAKARLVSHEGTLQGSRGAPAVSTWTPEATNLEKAIE